MSPGTLPCPARTPLQRAWGEFSALLTARDRARRNPTVPPAPEALTSAAENLLREFAAELPENRPVKAELPEGVPNPPENLDELRAAIDRINSIAADLTDEINKGPQMDAARTADLIRELRSVLDDQHAAADDAARSPGGDTDRPAPIESVPPDVSKTLVAAALTRFAPVGHAYAYLDAISAAELQHLYAAKLAEHAAATLDARPRRTTGRGVPLW